MNDRKEELLKEKAVFLNIVLTKRCHSNCRSCMFGCNPRLTKGLTMDYDFEQLKKDLNIIRNFNLKDVVVLGGEVLELDEEILLKYLRLIRDS
jgi:2-iminoacetate synthase ThiH